MIMDSQWNIAVGSKLAESVINLIFMSRRGGSAFGMFIHKILVENVALAECCSSRTMSKSQSPEKVKSTSNKQ